MNKKENVKKVDILEVLLDEENTAPIILYSEEGKRIEFEQVAVIPLGEELFCILKPITKIDGIKPDEAVAFKVVEEGEFSWVKVVEDELTAMCIFEAYYDLLNDEVGGNKKND